ncbi:hypothetical protein HY346_03320 [Candidatus Microgenomates bacterium]|nr:hypothetical protein [Candidatus Microgenomates bacterium]
MNTGALVALYGDKPAKLVQFIADCQAEIVSVAGSAFHPYDIRQVHATIVGVEQATESTMVNAYFYEYRGKQVQMNFGDLLNFLRNSGCAPLQVQIGGFQQRDYPFVSHGAGPYERSFAFHGGKAVVIGWPIRGTPITNHTSTAINLIHESQIYPNTLDKIRQAVQTFGFLHRYYRRPEDVDNDFYFRVGLFDPESVPESMQSLIERTIRQFLSDLEPVVIEITLSDICLAFSDKETLPLDSTRLWSISDPNVTANSIEDSIVK